MSDLTMEHQRQIQFANTYEILPLLLDMQTEVDQEAWLHMIGEHWPDFDNVSQHAFELSMNIPSGNIPEMMDVGERKALAALPDVVTIYRGCDRASTDGLCWTLDKSIAERFLQFDRYRRADPVIVTATVHRADITAIKLGRNEQEVIVMPDAVTITDINVIHGEPACSH